MGKSKVMAYFFIIGDILAILGLVGLIIILLLNPLANIITITLIIPVIFALTIPLVKNMYKIVSGNLTLDDLKKAKKSYLSESHKRYTDSKLVDSYMKSQSKGYKTISIKYQEEENKKTVHRVNTLIAIGLNSVVYYFILYILFTKQSIQFLSSNRVVTILGLGSAFMLSTYFTFYILNKVRGER